ncbi:uncharacterized protein LOC111196156 [Astyanax mexicanus]|uniref:uncharacterized protein LOC111196156 n=1 Tax=Astyanax mexicanus TaxID=7994 RepID=UPI0020CB15A3|nr:uncharacterized protein LOC111196156 [Astyanax mexicanus]
MNLKNIDFIKNTAVRDTILDETLTALAPNFVVFQKSQFELWFQEYLFVLLASFQPSYLVLIPKNLSCDSYKAILKGLDMSLNVLPLDLEEELRSSREMMSQALPKDCRAPFPVGVCKRTVVDEHVCQGVGSHLPQTQASFGNDSAQLCNFSIYEYACSSVEALTSNDLVTIMTCNLASGKDYSRVTWKLFFQKFEAPLEEALDAFSNMTLIVSLTDPHVLDAIGEVKVNNFTEEQLADAVFINEWFQIRLRPFLSTVSSDFLSCLSSKKFSCQTFQVVVEALSSQEKLMEEEQKWSIFSYFIYPFITRNDLSDAACVSSTSGSRNWLLKNFGKFSKYATLEELDILNADFSSFDSLDLLTPSQAAELTLTSGPLNSTSQIDRVFDRLKTGDAFNNVDDFLTTLSDLKADLSIVPAVRDVMMNRTFQIISIKFSQFETSDWMEWFDLKLIPVLPSFTAEMLQITITNITCTDYQVIVSGMSKVFSKMSASRREEITEVLVNFLKEFAAQLKTPVCRKDIHSDADWLTTNLGLFLTTTPYSVLKDFNISRVAVLESLSPAQKAELILDPTSGALENDTLVTEVMIRILSSSGEEQLYMFFETFANVTKKKNIDFIKNTAVRDTILDETLTALAPNFVVFQKSQFELWFQKYLFVLLASFQPSYLVLIPKNLSCDSYKAILKGLDMSLNVLPLDLEEELRSSREMMSHALPKDCRAPFPVGVCKRTVVDEHVCQGVGSHLPQTQASFGNDSAQLCNFSIYEYACSSVEALTSNDLVTIMTCNLASGKNYSRVTWKLFFQKFEAPLEEALDAFSNMTLIVSLTDPHVLDAIGEVKVNNFTEEQLAEAVFINEWFQIRLRPFLSTVSSDFLSCLSSKKFSCQTFQVVVEALSSQDKIMEEEQKWSIFSYFIYPFITRNDLSDVGCVSSTSGSRNWLLKNFGKFSKYATLEELDILNADFSSFDSLDLLTPSQAAELTLTSGPLNSTSQIDRVFDRLKTGDAFNNVDEFLTTLSNLKADLSIVPAVRDVMMNRTFQIISIKFSQFETSDWMEWFDLKLIPVLPSFTAEMLQITITNITCTDYQVIVSGMSKVFSKMSASRREEITEVLVNFLKEFAAQLKTPVCRKDIHSDADWLTTNLGLFLTTTPYSVLKDFNISGVAVLESLSPAQKAELILDPISGALENETLVTEVMIRILSSSGEEQLYMFFETFANVTKKKNIDFIKNTAVRDTILDETLTALAPNFVVFQKSQFELWFQEYLFVLLASFQPSYLVLIPKNLSCDSYKEILKGLDMSLNVLPLDLEEELRSSREMMSQALPKDCRAPFPVGVCKRTVVDEHVCQGVGSHLPQTQASFGNDSAQLCNFSIYEYACSSVEALTSNDLVTIMTCNLASGKDYSRITWKLFFQKFEAPLEEALDAFSNMTLIVSLTDPHVLDAIGEVKVNNFTEEQLAEAVFINEWFQIRLRPFLSTVSSDFLSCLSSKKFSCQTFQVVVEALSSQDKLMEEEEKWSIFSYFIYPFITRNDLSDAGCVSSTSGSRNWLLKNFGKFSKYATLEELDILNADFSSFDSLDLLTPSQAAELTLTSGPLNSTSQIDRVFDRLKTGDAFNNVDEFLTTLSDLKADLSIVPAVRDVMMNRTFQIISIKFPQFETSDWMEWFDLKLIPVLPSFTAEMLQITITNITCTDYQVIVGGLSSDSVNMPKTRKQELVDVLVAHLRKSLQQFNQPRCRENIQTVSDWLTVNLGQFSNYMSYSQLAELNISTSVIDTTTTTSATTTIATHTTVADVDIATTPASITATDTTTTESDSPPSGFETTTVTSVYSNTNDVSINSSNTTTTESTSSGITSSENVIVSNSTINSVTSALIISCQGVDSRPLETQLQSGDASEVLCSFTIPDYACSSAVVLSFKNLTTLLTCKLSSSVKYSKEMWTIFFQRFSAQLDEALDAYSNMTLIASLTDPHVLDAIGEVKVNNFTEEQLADAVFINEWFQIRLRPFLSTASKDFLSHLSSKQFNCLSYQVVVEAFSSQEPLMKNQQKLSVITDFIIPFLSRADLSDAGCVSSTSGSRNWLLKNFGKFSKYATLEELDILNADFSSFDSLDLLTPSQAAELTLTSGPLNSTSQIDRVFDRLKTGDAFNNVDEFLTTLSDLKADLSIVPAVRDVMMNRTFQIISIKFSQFKTSDWMEWFDLKLIPVLPSFTAEMLQITITNITCTDYQVIVSGMSKVFSEMSASRREEITEVLVNFLKEFAAQLKTPVCRKDVHSDADWLTTNLGLFLTTTPYSVLKDFNISRVAVLESLSKLIVDPTSEVLKNEMLVKEVMTGILSSSVEEQIYMFFESFINVTKKMNVTSIPAVVSKTILNMTLESLVSRFQTFSPQDFTLWFQTYLRLFLPGIGSNTLSVIPRNISCDSYREIVKGFNIVYSDLSISQSGQIFSFIQDYLQYKSSQEPNGLSCYSGGSFFVFLKSFFLSFGFPDLSGVLSIIPANRQKELLGSISPGELSQFLNGTNTVGNGSDFCTFLNNYNSIGQYLEKEPVVSAAVGRQTLACVWSRALSASSQDEVDQWFNVRLGRYLPFLSSQLINSTQLSGASCLSYRKLVSFLGNNYNFSGTDFTPADVYSSIKSYLKSSDGSPRCYNSSDPLLNSTAWFSNNIGFFITFITLTDLQSFVPEDKIGVFLENPQNLQLFNNTAITSNVTQYYSSQLFIQNPAIDLLRLPGVLLCGAPGFVFLSLGDKSTKTILESVNKFCSGINPEISTALVRNFPTISTSTIQTLGNQSVGLTQGQISTLTPTVINSTLPTLSTVTGWNQGQANALIKSITSAGFTINSASSLVSLGTLIAGVPSATISSIPSTQLLNVSQNPTFISNVLSAPVVLQRKYVQKIVSVDKTRVVQNVPDALAAYVPRVLLTNLRFITVTLINKKSWSQQQAAVMFGEVSKSTVDTEQLSESVLQGFTCNSVKTLSLQKIRQLVTACRPRAGRNKVVLKESQLSCMNNYVKQDSSLSFTDVPSDMLLYYSYKKVQTVNCRSYFSALGAADFSVLSRGFNKPSVLFSNAQNCLGISGFNLSKDQVGVLGNMICTLNPSYIQNSDPLILENLKNCGDLSDTQVTAIQTLLFSGNTQYGNPTAWNLRTLQQLDILPLYFKQDFWDKFGFTLKKRYFRSFLPMLRKRKTLKWKLGRLIRASMAGTYKRSADCTFGNITAVTIADELFPYGYDSTQFDLCLDATVLNDNLAAVTEKVVDESLEMIILDKLNQLYPSGLPESVVQLLSSTSRVANVSDISKWSITTIDTLSSLMNPDNGDWTSDQSKAVIMKYLSVEGNTLGMDELNSIGSNLCSLDVSVLKTITADSLGTAVELDISSCSIDQKSVLYSIANSSFSSQTNDSSMFYQLISPYLGGAPVEDIRALSTQNISMDISTFLSLNPAVIMDLSVSTVQDLMGVNIADLKTFEESSVIQAWVAQQKQSELNTLNIDLQGGIDDINTSTSAPVTSTSITDSETTTISTETTTTAAETTTTAAETTTTAAETTTTAAETTNTGETTTTTAETTTAAAETTTTAAAETTTTAAETTTTAAETTTTAAETTTTAAETTTTAAETTTTAAETTTTTAETTTTAAETTTTAAETTTTAAETTTTAAETTTTAAETTTTTAETTTTAAEITTTTAAETITTAAETTTTTAAETTTTAAAETITTAAAETITTAAETTTTATETTTTATETTTTATETTTTTAKDTTTINTAVNTNTNYIDSTTTATAIDTTSISVSGAATAANTSTSAGHSTTSAVDTTNSASETTMVASDTTTTAVDTSTTFSVSTTTSATDTTKPAVETTISVTESTKNAVDTTTIHTTASASDTSMTADDTSTIAVDITTTASHSTTNGFETITTATNPADITMTTSHSTTTAPDTTSRVSDSTTTTGDTITTSHSTTTLSDTITSAIDTTKSAAETTKIAVDTTATASHTTASAIDITTTSSQTTSIAGDTTNSAKDTTTTAVDATTTTSQMATSVSETPPTTVDITITASHSTTNAVKTITSASETTNTTASHTATNPADITITAVNTTSSVSDSTTITGHATTASHSSTTPVDTTNSAIDTTTRSSDHTETAVDTTVSTRETTNTATDTTTTSNSGISTAAGHTTTRAMDNTTSAVDTTTSASKTIIVATNTSSAVDTTTVVIDSTKTAVDTATTRTFDTTNNATDTATTAANIMSTTGNPTTTISIDTIKPSEDTTTTIVSHSTTIPIDTTKTAGDTTTSSSQSIIVATSTNAVDTTSTISDTTSAGDTTVESTKIAVDTTTSASTTTTTAFDSISSVPASTAASPTTKKSVDTITTTGDTTTTVSQSTTTPVDTTTSSNDHTKTAVETTVITRETTKMATDTTTTSTSDTTSSASSTTKTAVDTTTGASTTTTKASDIISSVTMATTASPTTTTAETTTTAIGSTTTSDFCTFLNNYNSIDQYLEKEPVVSAAVGRQTLACVWSRALSASSQDEVDQWFNVRLGRYLPFLSSQLINSTQLSGASCLSYRKLVSVLGNNYNFSGTDFTPADVYSSIKSYLKSSDGSPRCYNSSDPILNSTAWFSNNIGFFITFITLTDLQSFVSDSKIGVFLENRQNLQLFNNSAISADVTKYYSSQLFIQNPALNPLSLPGVLLCGVPGSAFVSLGETESQKILAIINQFCPQISPEARAALVANLPTISTTTITSLGNQSVGLTEGQITAATPSIINTTLPTLSIVTGWNQGQAKALIQSLTSAGYKIDSGSSLVTLGTLIGGVSSSTLSSIPPTQLLNASYNPTFITNILSAPVILKETYVQQIVSVDQTKVVENVPDALASYIPPVILSSPTSVNVTLINKKSWRQEQALVLFGPVASASSDTEELSESVLQGFTCSSVQTLSVQKIRQLVKACRPRTGRNRITLKESQLTCMYNYVKEDSTLNFTDLPSNMLLYYSYDKVPKEKCTSFFSALSAADFSIPSSVLNLPSTLFKSAQDCLGISGFKLSRDQVGVLGNMICTLNPSYIQNSDPLILENLKNCGDLSDTQVTAIQTLLFSGNTPYGNHSSWNLHTLGQMGMLPLYMKRDFWAYFSSTTKATFLKSFVTVLKTQKMEIMKLRKFFTEINVSFIKRRRAITACTTGNITEATIADPSFPFGYDSTQFDACLDIAVLRDNIAAITDKVVDTSFQTIILNKLNELFPSGLPNNMVQLLGSTSRMATASDISKWNITTIDTLSSLMDPINGDWTSEQSKAVIMKYLSMEGNTLGTAELNAIASNLCSLDVNVLKTITANSLKKANFLNISLCSMDQKSALYSIANSSFSSQRSDPTTYFQLIGSYLGGAPVNDVQALSTQNISLDITTFRSLNPAVLSALSVGTVRDLLGVNLPDLKLFENSTEVQFWVDQQYKVDLETLNIGLIGGKDLAVSTTTATTNTTTVTTVTNQTVAATAQGSAVVHRGSGPWFITLCVALLTITLQILP